MLPIERKSVEPLAARTDPLHARSRHQSLAPILIQFPFASVHRLFIGLLGKCMRQSHTQAQKRPLVAERDRIDF